jgi:YD repeat-containing protein
MIIRVMIRKHMLAISIAILLIISSPFVTYAAIITYTYNANGQITKADYGNGWSIIYTYDAAGNIIGKATLYSSATEYTLTVSKAGSGSGTVSPSTGSLSWNGSTWSGLYPSNTSVVLTANVLQGSAFLGWSGEGCSGTGTCTVVMTQARNVTATFSLKADFTGTPRSCSAPLAVSFTDASTPTPSSWLWDFGDGTTTTLRNPTHEYKSAGGYTVSLTVNGAGGPSVTTKGSYINVTACGNQPIKIGGTNTYFSSIQGGYGQLQSGQYLQMQALDFTESLNLQNSTAVTLRGGYACDYSANNDYTTIHGSVTIRAGTVTAERITIAP